MRHLNFYLEERIVTVIKDYSITELMYKKEWKRILQWSTYIFQHILCDSVYTGLTVL